MNRHYAQVAQRANHRCEYCRAPEVIFNFPFEVEHIVPAVHGGQEDESNLALACRSCNLFKADRLTAHDEATGEDAPLFHPRHHRWQEHFEFDRESAEIRGITAVGRVTVKGLQMNSSLQLAARRQWARLDLFP
jgi:HNH endonuclease